MLVFDKKTILSNENDCCNLVDELEALIKQEVTAYFNKLQSNIDAYAYFLANYIFLYGRKSAEKIIFSSLNYRQFIDDLAEKIKFRLETFFGRTISKQDVPGFIFDRTHLDDEIKEILNTRLSSIICRKVPLKVYGNACKAILPFPINYIISEVKPGKKLFEGIYCDEIKKKQYDRIRQLLKGALKSLELKTKSTLCRQVVDDVYSLWDETYEEPEFQEKDAV